MHILDIIILVVYEMHDIVVWYIYLYRFLWDAVLGKAMVLYSL
jgi:hypothetical protein